MVTLRLFNGAIATLHKNLLRSKIEVKIKSFHGARKVYTIDIPIDKTVNDIKDMLIKADTEGDLKGFIKLGLYCTIVIFALPQRGN